MITPPVDKQISLDRLRQTRKHLRELTEHPGWPVYATLVGDLQDDLVRALVMKPLANTDEALAQEYMKGRYAAFDQCLNNVGEWLRDLDLQIASAEALERAEQQKKEPANADANSTNANDGAGGLRRRSP